MSGRGNKAGAGAGAGGDDTVIRIPPHFYIHVLDLKTNVTKPIIGPETFVRQVMTIIVERGLF
jgi:major vault protein